jgi:hypothetical protein
MASAHKFIDRTYSLSEYQDHQHHIVPLIEEGYEAEELLDDDQNLIGWTVKKM